MALISAGIPDLNPLEVTLPLPRGAHVAWYPGEEKEEKEGGGGSEEEEGGWLFRTWIPAGPRPSVYRCTLKSRLGIPPQKHQALLLHSRCQHLPSTR